MKRSSPLKRTTPLRNRTRIQPVSARRRQRDASYPEARRVCWERHEGCCARCRLFVQLEVGHVHHIAGRGGADPHRQSNLVLACPACHRHMHDNPAESYAKGWLRRRNGASDDC